MGWKDLMKNVTDKATSVAETAQAKFEEQKQLSAIKKEEQNKKMEEMNERVTEYEQELLQNILSGFSGAPCIEVEDNILDFTKDYFEKLLLPANSVSASKITMYPYSDKIQKKAQKALREYDDTETPVFQFEGNKGEFILMTPTKLYIAVAFPENQTFVANVAVDLQQVSQFGFVSTEEGYQVVCNGVELFSADNVSEFDRITIEEYVRRLEEKDFEITETQIDEVIKKKIGDNIEKCRGTCVKVGVENAMKKALKYLISVIIAIIVAGFFIYLLIPALTGFMTLVGIVVVIAIVITVVKKHYK